MICKSHEPFKYVNSDYQTYGMRWWDTATIPDVMKVGSGYYLKAFNLKRPAEFWLQGDSSNSLTNTNGYKQAHVISPKKSTTGMVHLRHGGRANLNFIDGHVETLALNWFKRNPDFDYCQLQTGTHVWVGL